MKSAFSTFAKAGITDLYVSKMTGISYYAVRQARNTPLEARMDTVRKLDAFAKEVKTLLAAAKRIQNQ